MIPNWSSNTFAIGAKQLVVHDAQLITVSDPSRISWLVLKTIVLRSPVAGAEITTFLAPAVIWAAAFSLSVKNPVHSRTTSTFTDIIGRIDKVSGQITKAYGPGVLSVLRDTLEPINDDLKVYFGEYIAELEARYAKKPSEKLKKLIEDTKAQWDSFRITDDKLADLISGRYGDTNTGAEGKNSIKNSYLLSYYNDK